MEFDKSRIYTAVNADELPIGSKCIFADTIQDLRIQIQRENYEDCICLLKRIRDDNTPSRFDNGAGWFDLAYFIEPPKEPQYKPFSSVDKVMEAIKKHGGWVKSNSNEYFFITGCALVVPVNAVFVDDRWSSVDYLYKEFVFADDNTPCGELVEEE